MPQQIPADLEISQYLAAFLMLLMAVGLVVLLLTLAWLLRPRNPTPEKQMTYECGETPLGSAWLRFNIRFYVVALVFVLFDVEMALVYPIACIFRDITREPGSFGTGAIVFGELFFFVAVLFLGLIYVWKKGDLGWIRTFRMPTDRGIRSWGQQGIAPAAPAAPAAPVAPAAPAGSPAP